MLIINLALFGAIGLTIWAVQMIWIPFFAAGVINGIGHVLGLPQFRVSGRGNQHRALGHPHRRRRTAQQSSHLSELGQAVAEALGIRYRLVLDSTVRDPAAWPRRAARGRWRRRFRARQTLDLDTAWAVLNDRFRVMARYAEERGEAAGRAGAFRAGTRAGSCVVPQGATREESSLVDEAGQGRIAELIDDNATIKTIYEFRLRLQEVWAKRGGNAEEMLQALKQWCVDAEATGIQALRILSRICVPTRCPRPAARLSLHPLHGLDPQQVETGFRVSAVLRHSCRSSAARLRLRCLRIGQAS